ncbi:MAG: glycoside hydrolase family 99-like domain-containing protein [Niabella sp.]
MARFIAFYLPQFHPTNENDKWWGKGFTEWHSVVRAKPLFWGHKQPHLPADLGFYDLRLEETRIAQAELARKSGIEGFCYWHYWFGNGKRLLERPFNEVLTSGKPDFPFCLGWANHSWEKKLWDKNGTSEVLIEQTYPGEDDYINHFNAVLPAFLDKRYIKVNDKPLFVIYHPGGSPEIPKFIATWRKLAKQHGVNDIFFVAKDNDSRAKENILAMGFDAIYNLDHINIHHHLNLVKKIWLYICREWLKIPTVFEYKDAINYMVTDKSYDRDVMPSIAPNWDHSPRSGRRAIILQNSRPDYFKKVVHSALKSVANKPKDEQIVFLVSWNEWGEGNYLEPDTEFGHGYLHALRDAVEEFGNSKR